MRDVLVLVGGTGGGQLVVLAVSPLLTRLYTPEDFGLFAAYVGLLAPLVILSSLQYELAIPLPERDEDASALVVVSLGVLGLVTLAVAGAAFAAKGWIGAVLEAPGIESMLWLLPVGVAAAGGYKILSYWAIRLQAFKTLARTKVSQGVGLAVTQLGLGSVGVGAIGLVAGDIVGRASGSGTLTALLARANRRRWGGVDRARLAAAIVRYRRYPTMAAPGSLLNALGSQMPALLIVALYGAQAGGWFALTTRIVAVPVGLIGAAVAQVYLERAARAAREEPSALAGLYRSALGRLLLVGTPPLVLLGVLAPVVFPVVFGAAWETAGLYAAVLALPFALHFAASPLAHMLNVIGREDLLLGWNVLRAVLIGGGLLGAWWSGGGALAAVAAYGAALALSYGAMIALTLVTTRQDRSAAAGPPANV